MENPKYMRRWRFVSDGQLQRYLSLIYGVCGCAEHTLSAYPTHILLIKIFAVISGVAPSTIMTRVRPKFENHRNGSSYSKISISGFVMKGHLKLWANIRLAENLDGQLAHGYTSKRRSLAYFGSLPRLHPQCDSPYNPVLRARDVG